MFIELVNKGNAVGQVAGHAPLLSHGVQVLHDPSDQRRDVANPGLDRPGPNLYLDPTLQKKKLDPKFNQIIKHQ